MAEDPLRREVVLNVAAAAAGVLGALMAYLFRAGVGVLQNAAFFDRIALSSPPLLGHPLGPWVVALPFLGTVGGIGLLYLATRSTEAGSTVAVVEAASFRGGRLSLKDSLGRALGAIVTLGLGGSAGREGPMVLLGGSSGSTIGEGLGLDRKDRRILIAAGATGAIAATFNAPVAAVVFAIEAIFFEFRTESFVPIVVASVFGTAVGRVVLGDHPTFDLAAGAFELTSPLELGLVVPLGVAAGLAGFAFLWLSERTLGWFEERPVWARPLIGGTAMGAIGLAFPRLLGVGYDTMQTVLDGALRPEVLGSLVLTFAVLMVLKPIAVSMTLGGGGTGGVFSPTIFVGIMLGALFGLGAGQLMPDLASGYPVYAVLGMAAVFAAVSRAGLTAIILSLEFTRTFEILLPAMLAVVIADIVAWSLHREGLFATRLRGRGVRLPHDLSANVLDMVLVREIMTPDVETLPTGTTVRECLDTMLETGHGSFPVLDDAGDLVGIVTRRDLRTRPEEVGLDDPIVGIMSEDVVVALPDETAHRAFDRMVAHQIGHVPVVEEGAPTKVVGLVTRSDVLRAEAFDDPAVE